jgi:hypothetical protein
MNSATGGAHVDESKNIQLEYQKLQIGTHHCTKMYILYKSYICRGNLKKANPPVRVRSGFAWNFLSVQSETVFAHIVTVSNETKMSGAP